MNTLGELVKKIQSESTSDKAVEEYSLQAKSNGLSDSWIRAVFSVKTSLPVLDELFDVHTSGTTILTQMGISAEVQSKMWEKWPTLPEDVRASWIDSFADVDQTDLTDISKFIKILVELLT